MPDSSIAPVTATSNTRPTQNIAPLLCTVQAMADRMEGVGVGYLRSQIFNHSKKMEDAGALVRVGYRVFINPLKYMALLEKGGLNK